MLPKGAMCSVDVDELALPAPGTAPVKLVDICPLAVDYFADFDHKDGLQCRICKTHLFLFPNEKDFSTRLMRHMHMEPHRRALEAKMFELGHPVDGRPVVHGARRRELAWELGPPAAHLAHE